MGNVDRINEDEVRMDILYDNVEDVKMVADNVQEDYF